MERPKLKDIVIQFSREIIAICHHLDSIKLPTISKQLIRCGTAIGALAAEASEAESADDFIHKMKLALKEAKETMYWLEIVRDKIVINQTMMDELVSMQKIITTSIQTAKKNRDLQKRHKT